MQAGMVVTVEPGCYFNGHLIDAALADPELSRFLVADRIQVTHAATAAVAATAARFSAFMTLTVAQYFAKIIIAIFSRKLLFIPYFVALIN